MTSNILKTIAIMAVLLFLAAGTSWAGSGRGKYGGDHHGRYDRHQKWDGHHPRLHDDRFRFERHRHPYRYEHRFHHHRHPVYGHLYRHSHDFRFFPHDHHYGYRPHTGFSFGFTIID